MEKISYRQNKLRVPVAAGDIQVNFCKNPACPNYGVSASTQKQPRGPGAKLRGRDNYKVQASGNPESIIKVLCIFRTFYNYTQSGKDLKTPAMRLELAKGLVKLEDIIYE